MTYVTGWVYNEYLETPVHMRPRVIAVDVIGIGAGVVDGLKELGLPVKGVNVAEAESNRYGLKASKYERLRDELWFKAWEWFLKGDCKIPEDEDLIGELCSVTYDILSNGKFKVESKRDMKKRGIRSPDIADSFIITFAIKDKIRLNRGARRNNFAKSDYNIFG